MRPLYLNFLVILWCFGSTQLYSRSFKTDSKETVLGKHYPKKYRVEVLPTATMVLNQSFISTIFLGGQLSFYPSEAFGLHVEGMFGINNDTPERHCLETFYNDPKRVKELGYVCGYALLQSKGIFETSSEKARNLIGNHILERNAQLASLGPAYMPIREIDLMMALTFSWNLIYGKQLAFMKFTNYFDLYLKFGGGVALSTYYPAQIHVKDGDGRKYRTNEVELNDADSECSDAFGVCVNGENANPNWVNLIGAKGRPDALKELSPMATAAFGYRFHFLGRLHLSAEVRSYLLIATGRNREVKDRGEQTSAFTQNFEHYLMVSGGLGFRL